MQGTQNAKNIPSQCVFHNVETQYIESTEKVNYYKQYSVKKLFRQLIFNILINNI